MYHMTRDGTRIFITEMQTSHLVNTIKYFQGKRDVSPYLAELILRSNQGHGLARQLIAIRDKVDDDLSSSMLDDEMYFGAGSSMWDWWK